ncbi:serine/threonine-protein kinase [Nocardioides silvaticus]|uniref:serine/threonine-protein kinase n=1 Tax=Nocardioides silvaticus TaxID=2201891 RepID=UPI001B860A3C|nr:serine/threonine-protein kinase [Nocardioides silvaticus]
MSVPARLGRYVVRRRIGSGAFATVWLAFDEQLDSPVAVKVLAENWSEDDHVRRRFLEEGRMLRKVESPHVVTVYDAGELDDGRPYLVMTYADQGTLADRLEVDGLTAAQALEVIRQVGLGLQALHTRSILHRDVKPANVLFRTVDGRVRAMVADLGLGKSLDVSSRLSVIAGTPSYVAPEQAQGEPLDARADQYSLAALTYLLLAGRPPYQHASLAAAAEPDQPPPLSSTERPVPTAAEAVVVRGLAVDREQRWPDVASYVEALTSALTPLPPDDRPAEPWLPVDPDLTQPGARPSLAGTEEPLPDPPSPRHRLRRGAAVGLAVAAIAGGGLAGWLVAGAGGDDWTEVQDDTGSLGVSVPADWDRAVAADGWRPPEAERDYPALSVGTSRDWTEDPDGHGVFLGLLAGSDLPEQVPQHPECGEPGDPVTDSSDDGPAITVVYPDCPGGIVVERAVQVTDDQLLWVQVRSSDTATANRVLDSVAAYGFR